MNKEVIIVYQDCFMCGSPESWSEKAKIAAETLKKAGAKYRKLSFATIEGQAHCAKAIENGVKTMPFFTDGKIYAQDVKSLLEAESAAQNEPKKTAKRAKKTKTTKKELNNGPAE